MALRTMPVAAPLWRVKVVRRKSEPNPAYTGRGCGEDPRIFVDGETVTYFGPYTRRHAAVTVGGQQRRGWDVVSADIETCQPSWEVVT
ncbi:hypothetical protein ACFVRU_01480 [Streptomyces sp. NPDC057927]